jgi:type VI secretion system protein ImpD
MSIREQFVETTTLFEPQQSALPQSPPTLLSQLLLAGAQQDSRLDDVQHQPKRSVSLQDFLKSSRFDELVRMWFGEDRLRNQMAASGEWLLEQLDRDIATIDTVIQSQLNSVMHAESFQRLEATWRGLEYLVAKKDEYSDTRVQIKILNVSWGELSQDFEKANEFDQSEFFRKVYEEGFGQAGASPFSAMIADYFVHPRLSPEHSYDDIHVLRELSHVAAAAFCPLITNAHPSMLSVDRFSDVKSKLDIKKLHSGLDFHDWQRLREIEDSRFVSLAIPRILMRRPYDDVLQGGFPFTESIASTDDYLWGGAAFAMGEVMLRSFADSGWFANIRGVQRGLESGGLVTGPCAAPHRTEPFENATRPLTDVVFTDDFERDLSSTGFLPLCAGKESPYAAFYSSCSVQKAKEHHQLEATMSARLSTMLNYMLCVSRFAHYLKIIARNRIGSCGSPEELQEILRNWIISYVSEDREAGPETRLRKPLLEAEIKVFSIPGKAGEYKSIFHLVPHHELDDMRVAIRLEDTRLVTSRV